MQPGVVCQSFSCGACSERAKRTYCVCFRDLYDPGFIGAVPHLVAVVVLDEQLLASVLGSPLIGDGPLKVFPTIPNEPPHSDAPRFRLCSRGVAWSRVEGGGAIRCGGRRGGPRGLLCWKQVALRGYVVARMEGE